MIYINKYYYGSCMVTAKHLRQVYVTVKIFYTLLHCLYLFLINGTIQFYLYLYINLSSYYVLTCLSIQLFIHSGVHSHPFGTNKYHLNKNLLLWSLTIHVYLTKIKHMLRLFFLDFALIFLPRYNFSIFASLKLN